MFASNAPCIGEGLLWFFCAESSRATEVGVLETEPAGDGRGLAVWVGRYT